MQLAEDDDFISYSKNSAFGLGRNSRKGSKVYSRKGWRSGTLTKRLTTFSYPFVALSLALNLYLLLRGLPKAIDRPNAIASSNAGQEPSFSPIIFHILPSCLIKL